MDEAGIAAAWRSIDAAVRARGGEHAERRHADELPGMDVDLRPRLGDHARRGRWVDRSEVARAEIGQDILRSKQESGASALIQPRPIIPQDTISAVRRPLTI